MSASLAAWTVMVALAWFGSPQPVSHHPDRGWIVSSAPLYMTSMGANLYLEQPTPKGFVRTDLSELKGPPRIRSGDRLHLQVNAFPFTWSYLLIEHTLYSWTLLWSWGPRPLDQFGIPRRPDPYPWVAGPEMPGANRLIFVSSLVPLPALESMRVSRVCQMSQKAPPDWPYPGKIAGNGDDAICNFTMLLNDRLPRERRGQDPSGLHHGNFVWKMWEDGHEVPAYISTARDWGIAATTLKIQGVR